MFIFQQNITLENIVDYNKNFTIEKFFKNNNKMSESESTEIDTATSTEDNKCSICFEDIDLTNEELCFKPNCCVNQAENIYCKSVYHKECIDRWLQVKASCPICRTAIQTNSSGENVTFEERMNILNTNIIRIPLHQLLYIQTIYNNMIEDRLTELYPQLFDNINRYLTYEEAIRDDFQRYDNYFSNNSYLINSMNIQNKVGEVMILIRDFYIIHDEDDLSPRTKNSFLFLLLETITSNMFFIKGFIIGILAEELKRQFPLVIIQR